ncbi:MAG: electron transfer flavoprotein subunit alpha/FixB family protein [Bacteroidales bacterium]|nr:electron transfer flavoprotein subunit alpha/FixB family protein [Bacteroidales bacterium]
MSVLVYTENWDGAFKKQTFELASYASSLAAMLSVEPVAVSIGSVNEEELNKLAAYGIKKIIRVEDESLKLFDSRTYARLISDIALKEDAGTLVLANNNAGKALAPRLSVRLKAAVCSAVNQLPESIEPFVIRKKVFSGNAIARAGLLTDVKIVTLAQNSFDVTEQKTDATIEDYQPGWTDIAEDISVLEQEKQTGKVLLTDAEVVVSGGRGMKSPENWKPLEELAVLLDGATACSRPVSDEGWRPHEEHTGQTGKIIAPNLYFAIGISGATQHLAGISSSKVIVAINNDKDAPIFEAAQYGIVGDAAKILPKLVDAVRESKSS